MALSDLLAPLGQALMAEQPRQDVAMAQPKRPLMAIPSFNEAAPPVQVPQQPKRDSGFRRFLGNLGDALLVANGGQPLYQQRQQRRQMSALLSRYMAPTDPALAEIFAQDPETGMALLRMKQPEQQSPTALMQNMEYLRRLNPGMSDQQLAEVAQQAIVAPRMYGSPEMGWFPDPNYPFMNQPQQDGGISEGATATNPETGERIVYRNGAWVPMGGAGSDAGGGFR